ncbi:hypothetical protein GCM10019017_68810 [Streptomyces showdoensis]
MQRGGHGDDGDVEAAAVAHGVARPVAAGLQGGAQPLGGDVLDVRLARGEALDPLGVHVVPDHLVTGLGGPDGERQADIALSNHDDAHHDSLLAVLTGVTDGVGRNSSRPVMRAKETLVVR